MGNLDHICYSKYILSLSFDTHIALRKQIILYKISNKISPNFNTTQFSFTNPYNLYFRSTKTYVRNQLALRKFRPAICESETKKKTNK